MGLKEKAWLVALLGGIIAIIGWATPYIWITMTNPFPPPATVEVMYWSWGLAMTMGVTAFLMDIMIAGILIIIGAILALAAGFMAKKREDLKTMGIICIIAGALCLVGVFIPLGVMGVAVGLSIGFYLPLIGGILAIVAGIFAFMK